MTSNRAVVEAWAQGRVASAGNLRTDGRYLYSYGMCIGLRGPGGKLLVLRCKYSQTTSMHISRATRVADRVVEEPGHRQCASAREHCAHVRKLMGDTHIGQQPFDTMADVRAILRAEGVTL